jgi:MOSC domain-containing protein YiiM
MKLSENSPLQNLLETLPQEGKICWIGIRPERGEDLSELSQVAALTDKNLEGDHYHGRPGSKRQVTLIMQEHLDTVASVMKRASLHPGIIRRNLVVKGINLLALKDKRFQVGEAILEYTGECHPCSRMEENLGPGGYNAMRGHGGITARIISGGMIRLGDSVRVTEILKSEEEENSGKP